MQATNERLERLAEITDRALDGEVDDVSILATLAEIAITTDEEGTYAGIHTCERCSCVYSYDHCIDCVLDGVMP